MPRSFRYDIAAATAALCPASLGTFLWLFFAYFSSRPAKPNATLGFVHALNNHGSYVYLSDAESTGLALLMNVFMIGLFGMFAILPKDPALAPPGTARWLAHFLCLKDRFGQPYSSIKSHLPVLSRVLSCRHLSGGPHRSSFRCLPEALFCSPDLLSASSTAAELFG
jgi:hypothetical protein